MGMKLPETEGEGKEKENEREREREGNVEMESNRLQAEFADVNRGKTARSSSRRSVLIPL